MSPGPISSISAVTLIVADMARSVRFYRALGFVDAYGGSDADFTTLHAGEGQYLNLMATADDGPWSGWGRIILHVRHVDEMYETALAAGLRPESPPRDAEWGERYFHLRDPDGHELSFARPLDR